MIQYRSTLSITYDPYRYFILINYSPVILVENCQTVYRSSVTGTFCFHRSVVYTGIHREICLTHNKPAIVHHNVNHSLHVTVRHAPDLNARSGRGRKLENFTIIPQAAKHHSMVNNFSIQVLNLINIRLFHNLF